VRITTTESVAHCLLNPILLECRQRYPEIKLQVLISDKIANLSQRDADIAIRPARTPPGYLIGKLISPLAFAVYGARADWMAHAQSGEPPEWQAQQWIALDEAHRTLDWLAQYQEPDQIALRINGFAAVCRACVAGLGLALLPCFMGEQEPALLRLCPPIAELATDLWLLIHPDLRQTARISAVFQLLQQSLGARAALLRADASPA
jgi:DNA-binding transcriptional LysR family regulator